MFRTATQEIEPMDDTVSVRDMNQILLPIFIYSQFFHIYFYISEGEDTVPTGKYTDIPYEFEHLYAYI